MVKPLPFHCREVRLVYGRRTAAPPARTAGANAAPLVTPSAAAALLRPALEVEPVEVLGVLLLDSRHYPIGWHEVARGGLNAVSVAPREVFRAAIVAGAAALIVAHNHPSGDPAPSADDLAITRRMVSAGELLAVTVLDHVIIGAQGQYVSLKERGQL